MKLSIWSPLPPAPSGIADYVAESLDPLSRHAALEIVCPAPSSVSAEWRDRFSVRAPGTETVPDLDVYHVGNSPAHGYVFRAAAVRPGVLFLHEWNLHHLVLAETVERGDPEPYFREMRRMYRERGSFAGRQVARALGGDMLPALFPIRGPLLERSLAVVALNRATAERARRALPDRPVLHLPMHFAPPPYVPTRAEARRRLGLPADALVITAPGLATAAKRLDVALRALGRLRDRHPRLQLVIAGGVEEHLPLARWIDDAGVGGLVHRTGRLSDDDFVGHIVAADVILCLRFPSYGEMSAVLVREMGLGRPVLVTAGTPMADEMPPGTVVPVDPGPNEEAELTALLDRLLGDDRLREAIGGLARAHVRAAHDLDATVERLYGFLREVESRRHALLAAVSPEAPRANTLLGHFEEEVLWGARDLGLASAPTGLRALLAELAGAAEVK